MNRFQSTIARSWCQAERFASRRPWISAILLTPVLFVLLACVFQPAYETNDDPAMSMIASGRFFALAPDEHLIFTHPVIGLMLKSLYTHAPSLPWYALYLLTTQVVTHVVVSGLLLLYCPLRRALPWLAVWLATVGIFFITHLQFTATAFLAGMAGVLLLWEAARRVVARKNLAAATTTTTTPSVTVWPQTPNSILSLVVVGSALLLWCEMIRWYMFYLMAVLPLPAIGVWWAWQRPGWRITGQAMAVAAIIGLSGLGLKQWHMAYYQADPEWREFYEYNELRAQFNDTVKVVYNDQTRNSFDQAGWAQIDLQMIQAWCYDEPGVYSREKLQQIYDSRPWQLERPSLKKTLINMLPLLDEPPMRLGLALLVALTLIVPVDRRHFTFNAAIVGTAFGALVLLAIIQKSPPSRVYMPILVWSAVAISWNYLNRSLVVADSPALTARQAWQGLFARQQRLALANFNWARAVCLVLATLLIPTSVARVLRDHHKFQRDRTASQRELLAALDSFAPPTSKLYVLWAASIPVENLNPLNSLAKLDNYRILWFGWPQQMPTHRAMKARYGISNLLQEWSEHPEVEAICPEICTEFYAKFAKTHYAQDVRAVPAGTFLGNPVFRFQKAGEDLASEKQKLVQ